MLTYFRSTASPYESVFSEIVDKEQIPYNLINIK